MLIRVSLPDLPFHAKSDMLVILLLTLDISLRPPLPLPRTKHHPLKHKHNLLYSGYFYPRTTLLPRQHPRMEPRIQHFLPDPCRLGLNPRLPSSIFPPVHHLLTRQKEPPRNPIRRLRNFRFLLRSRSIRECQRGVQRCRGFC